MVATSDSGRAPGSLAGARTFSCSDCGYAITLLEGDDVPDCPSCGGNGFEPASIFSQETTHMARAGITEAPLWLDGVRESVAGKGPHVAWESDDSVEVAPLDEGFTRVGRSIQADIHLAGPTVSRRHALLHREGDCITVVDDHSLNGVFVDGEQVDWRQLEDGSQIELGGFQLHFISA
jgi:FHA domain-containing protein